DLRRRKDLRQQEVALPVQHLIDPALHLGSTRHSAIGRSGTIHVVSPAKPCLHRAYHPALRRSSACYAEAAPDAPRGTDENRTQYAVFPIRLPGVLRGLVDGGHDADRRMVRVVSACTPLPRP